MKCFESKKNALSFCSVFSFCKEKFAEMNHFKSAFAFLFLHSLFTEDLRDKPFSFVNGFSRKIVGKHLVIKAIDFKEKKLFKVSKLLSYFSFKTHLANYIKRPRAWLKL